MGDKIIFSTGGMCWLDDIRYVKWNPATGKWDVDAAYHKKTFRETSDDGGNAIPVSTYCVGRELPNGIKELCQPWVVENNKYNLLALNDNYFDALFDGIILPANACNLTPIVNVINACDFNYPERFMWSPFNPELNIQGIDKFYDLDAIPVVRMLFERLLQEQKKRGAKVIWEIGKEIDNPKYIKEITRLVEQVFTPLFKKYNIPGEQIGMGARTVPPEPLVQTQVRQAITAALGKPDDDLALRPTHGICKGANGLKPTPGILFAMSEQSDFASMISDDGGNREAATPEWWTAQIDYIFAQDKMRLPLVSKTGKTGVQRCKVSFEHFDKSELDNHAVRKAIVAACKKHGFTFENEGKFPELPVTPPVIPPVEPPVVVPPVKPPFNFRGWIGNRIKYFGREWGWYAALLIIVFLAIFIL